MTKSFQPSFSVLFQAGGGEVAIVKAIFQTNFISGRER
jgi:hypothetical protein